MAVATRRDPGSLPVLDEEILDAGRDVSSRIGRLSNLNAPLGVTVSTPQTLKAVIRYLEQPDGATAARLQEYLRGDCRNCAYAPKSPSKLRLHLLIFYF